MRTPSSSAFRTRSRISAALFAVFAAVSLVAQPAALEPVASRDNKVVRRWTLPGDPRGLAIGSDGTIYIGLAQPQTVIAVDPKTGAIRKRLVLDSADIASTKELVTMRTNPARTRLYIANGSDESATILSLPELGVLREITMEGEEIRDVVPDPRGRYVYLLGRRVHVFDKDGNKELRTLPILDPMAIAASANGSMLAVFATEDFGNAKATSVALLDTTSFAEVARDPLQMDRPVRGAMFAANDTSLIAFSADYLFEKPVVSRPAKAMKADGTSARMRISIDFGDLVNADRACFPDQSGPQVATLAGNTLVYAERRCSASGTFAGSTRAVTPASLYGVEAYAIAFDPLSITIVASEPKGFLTVYRMPRPAIAR